MGKAKQAIPPDAEKISVRRKIANMLGMAKRAGKLAVGCMAAEKALLAQKTYGLLVAADASGAAPKNCVQKAEASHVPTEKYLTGNEISSALGSDNDIAAVAVLDKGFWHGLEKLMKKG